MFSADTLLSDIQVSALLWQRRMPILRLGLLAERSVLPKRLTKQHFLLFIIWYWREIEEASR